jgi:hypothetical protein
VSRIARLIVLLLVANGWAQDADSPHFDTGGLAVLTRGGWHIKGVCKDIDRRCLLEGIRQTGLWVRVPSTLNMRSSRHFPEAQPTHSSI